MKFRFDYISNVLLTGLEMFLWVRLILTHLEDDAYNLNDLETVMANMPTSLKEL